MKQKLNTVLQQRHCFNPLNTNGDQYLVSLTIILLNHSFKIMRIKEMIAN